MASVMYVNIGLAVLNAVLSVLLGWVYWRNHREIRSPFTRGLLAFAVFLVVHNVIIIYHYATMMTTFAGVGETFLLVESVLQSAALIALVQATMR
ncbi:MAG: hypothetical protein ACT4PT_07020 [Methanobacteriota archaeon]